MMSSLLSDGYQIIRQLLDSQAVKNLTQVVSNSLQTDSNYGVRNLHYKISVVNKLATSQELIDYLSQYTNFPQFRLIKAIYFNKTKRDNWSVPWHQDKTIAVKNKVLIPNYKNWTVKQGVPHVQPPLEVLTKLTAIRIALDDSDINNGGLKIIPQTHNLGILDSKAIEQITQRQTPLSLSLKAGDVLMMHPLILHSSPKSISDNSRRVIHLEYSSGKLASELAWY